MGSGRRIDLGVPRTTGEILRAAGGLYRGYPWLFLLLAAAVMVPFELAVLAGRGERPRPGVVAIRGLRVLPTVVAAEAAAYVATTVGLILLIVPGVLLALMLAVSSQAAALEGGSWIGALRSSRDLTDGSYKHIIGLELTGGAIAVAANVGVRAVPLGPATGVAAVAAGIAVDTATASFAALTLALLYFDLKSRAAAPASESAAA